MVSCLGHIRQSNVKCVLDLFPLLHPSPPLPLPLAVFETESQAVYRYTILRHSILGRVYSILRVAIIMVYGSVSLYSGVAKTHTD